MAARARGLRIAVAALLLLVARRAVGSEPVDEFKFNIPINYQASFGASLLPPRPDERLGLIVGEGKHVPLWIPIQEPDHSVIPSPPLYFIAPVSKSRTFKLAVACRENSTFAVRNQTLTIDAGTGSGSYMVVVKEQGMTRVFYTSYHYTISFQDCSNQKATLTLRVAPDCRTVGNCPM